LIASAGVWVGGYLAGSEFYSDAIVLASISVGLVCGAGNAFNDFLDIESDKINHPQRPLAKGDLPSYYAILLMLVLTTVAVGIALIVSFKFALIVVISSGLLIAYNFKLKKIPIVGNLVISILSGMTFIVGGMTAGSNNLFSPPGPIVPAIFAVLFHLGREWIKDLADIDGDKLAGYKSFPMLISRNLMFLLLSILFLWLIFFTLIPIYYDWYNNFYFFITLILVDIPLIFVIVYLWLSKNDNRFSRLGSIIKLLMAFGLIAFIFGKN